MKKTKILILLIAVIVITGLMPTIALADTGHIYVRIAENQTDIFSPSQQTLSCGRGSATYDPGTNTLTLDNAEISTSQQGAIDIIGLSELTIVLKGTNTIASSYAYNQAGNYGGYGIYSDGADLTIQSENGGTLQVDATGNGIYAYNASIVVLDVSSLKIGTVTPVQANAALIADNLSINSSSIEVGAGNRLAFVSMQKMEIINSNLTAKGITESAIIAYYDSLTIDGSTIDVSSASLTPSRGYRLISAGGTNFPANISIKNSKVMAIQNHNHNSGRAIGADGNIEVLNTELTASATGIAMGTSSGDITLNGNISLLSKNNVSVRAASLNITGGEVELKSEVATNYNTRITTSISISNAKVTASGAYAGLGYQNAVNIDITDSTVHTQSTSNYYGIYTQGNVRISGNSDVIAEGAVGIYAGKVTVSPAAKSLVEVKVGSRAQGESGANHFSSNDVYSPFAAETSFTGDALTTLTRRGYFHSKNIPITYTATLNTAGLTGATVTLDKTSGILANDTVTVTIIPDAGRVFDAPPTVTVMGANAGAVTAGANGTYTCQITGFTTDATIWVSGNAPAPVAPDLPQTGDNNHIAMWGAMLMLSVAGMFMLLRRRGMKTE